MTREERKLKTLTTFKKRYNKLDRDLQTIVDKYLEQISIQLIKDNTIDSYKKIIDDVYDCLTAAYEKILSSFKSWYENMKPLEVDDVFKLAYNKDGKTIEDRVRSYFDVNLTILQQIQKFDVLIDYEVQNLKRYVEETRIKPLAEMLIIESDGCDCKFGCDEYAGEYSPDDDVPLPPYHPNCHCEAYYLYTDEEDDIEELDLEPD